MTNEFDILRAAAAGMEAQRSALDVAARNVAAAEATPGAEAFTRLVPRFAVSSAEGAAPDAYEPPGDVVDDGDGDAGALPVRYLGTSEQRGGGVDTVTEMVVVKHAFAAGIRAQKGIEL